MLTYEQLAETFPPGDVIKEELEERGWTQRDLADILQVQQSVVSALIKGTKPISLDLARNLAAAFGNSAQHWVNMDTAYRLNLPSEEHSATTRRSELYRVAPVNEMVKRGWIESSTDVDVLRSRVASFYDKESFEEIEKESLAYAARQGTGYGELTAPQRAWVYRVRKLARAVQAQEFRADSVTQALAKLRPLMGNSEEIRHVPRVLAECGIRLVIVEHLPQTRIDGVCVWVDGKPVIGLSLRFDRLDYFWFTLLHELGHVNNRDGISVMLAPLDSDLVGDKAIRSAEKSEMEQKADAFAGQNLVSPTEMDNFIARVKPMFSKVKIHGFALRQGVHPAIVMGQLQHKGAIHWSHSRKFLVKVREIVTSSALTDGWGQILPNFS